MAHLVSQLSTGPTVTLLPLVYTTAMLVSEATDGEILEADVMPEWIQAARDEVDRRSGLSFHLEEFTDQLDGGGLDTLFVRKFPVLEVNEIKIDGVVFDALPLTRTVFNPRTGALRRKDLEVWQDGLQNITVRYHAGSLIIPPLVTRIATLLVVKTALNAKHGADVDSTRVGNFSESRSYAKLNDELDRAWSALGTRRELHFA